MSADDGRLVLEVDATQPERATRSLKEFAPAAQGAEKAAASLGSSTKQSSRSIADMVASIERAVVGQHEFVRGLAEGAAAALQEERQLRKTAEATDDLARRAGKLKASVDPLGASIDRVNAELVEAEALYRAGAISAADYGQAQTALAGRLGTLTSAHDKLAKGQKLSAAEAMNFGRQMADVGVMAAMGMNPLMILITQGPQIADIFATMRAKGVGFTATLKELGVAMGVLKVVQAEQTTANAATAVSAGVAAAAETALAEAEGRTVGSAQAATAAAAEVVVANTAIATSATAAAAAEAVALAPLAVVLGGIAVAAAATAGGFALATRAINKDAKSVKDSLGLTADQMDYLKKKGVDTSITLGDTFKATAQVIGRHIMAGPIGDGLRWLQTTFGKVMDWVTKKGLDAIISVAAAWYAGWRTQIDIVKALPQAVAWAFTGAVNFAIDGINVMVKGALAGLNTLIGLINKIPGINIGTVEWGGLSRIKQAAAPDFGPGFGAYYGQARDGLRAGVGEIADQAAKNRDARVQKALEGYHAKKDSAGSRGSKSTEAQDRAEQQAAEIARLVAQAKGDELQAQLALVTDLKERARIEGDIRKAEGAAKQADLDKKIAEIRAAEHLSNKDALLGKLAEVKAIYANVEQLKDQAAARKLAVDLAHQEAQAQQAALDGQLRIVSASGDLAKFGFERRAVEEHILALQQQIERNKAQEAVDTAVGDYAKNQALLRQAEINQAQAIEAEVARLSKLHGATDDAVNAIQSLKDAIAGKDWASAFTSLIEAIGSAMEAFQRAGSSAERAGSAGGILSSAGSAIGGKAGGALSAIGSGLSTYSRISGMAGSLGSFLGGGMGAGSLSALPAGWAGAGQIAGSGALAGLTGGVAGSGGLLGGLGGALSSMAGPIGIAIAGFSLLSSVLGSNKAKKEAAMQAALKQQEQQLSEAREIATQGIQALKQAEEQRFSLLQRIYTATKDDAALQALVRKHELGGLDERNKALAEYAYALEDWRAGVDAAKASLQAAYDAEAGAIKDTVSAVESWIGTLKDLQRELLTGDLAMNSPSAQYGKTRAVYGSTFDLALSGNQAARDGYAGVAGQFLEASKANSRTMRDYQRDLALVKGNTKLLEETAGVQLTVAQQQLGALNAAVAGILTVNNSVMSVAAALANYQAAVASKPADRPDLLAEDPWKEGGTLWTQSRAQGQVDLASGAWGDPNKWNKGNAVDMVLGNLRTSPDQVRAWYADAKAKGSLLSVDAYLGLQAGTFAGFVRALNDPSMPVFATGGSFIVGGRSGTDQNVLSINGQAQARVSQGETIKVTSKGDPGSAAVVAAIQQLSDRMAKIEKHTETTANRLVRASHGKDGFVIVSADS